MDAQLTALAVSTATSLTQLMASDAWAAGKKWVTSLFGRGPADQSRAVETELEQARAALLTARADGDDAAVADIRAGWQARLLRLLEEDPAATDRAQALIRHVESQGTTVHNSVSGYVHGSVVQTGTINGDLHFG